MWQETSYQEQSDRLVESSCSIIFFFQIKIDQGYNIVSLLSHHWGFEEKNCVTCMHACIARVGPSESHLWGLHCTCIHEENFSKTKIDYKATTNSSGVKSPDDGGWVIPWPCKFFVTWYYITLYTYYIMIDFIFLY